MTRAEFTRLALTYGDAVFARNDTEEAALAALLAAYDALAERAEVAESALKAVQALTDVPSAVRVFNGLRPLFTRVNAPNPAYLCAICRTVWPLKRKSLAMHGRVHWRNGEAFVPGNAPAESRFYVGRAAAP